MKKRAIQRSSPKLQLSRETLCRLDESELAKVAGGESLHPICETETCSVNRVLCAIFG